MKKKADTALKQVRLSKEERQSPENNKKWLWTIEHSDGRKEKKLCTYVELVHGAIGSFIASAYTY